MGTSTDVKKRFKTGKKGMVKYLPSFVSLADVQTLIDARKKEYLSGNVRLEKLWDLLNKNNGKKDGKQ